MILLFPDTDTLRLAVTSNLVPAAVTLAPAAVTTDEQGRVYVESSVALPKGLNKTLDRLGVKGSKRHGPGTPRDVTSWLELLPLTKAAGTPAIAAQQPVLFELENADDLPGLVSEMLRLGNDRQGFRWFTRPDDADRHRVLLRVVGPPYYTLLRALDRPAAGGVRAYLEAAPRVWVELGHQHPLAHQVKLAEGQTALIQSPADWLFLDDAPFRDVYELLKFDLPAGPVVWEEGETADTIEVPLKLAGGNAADVPELWVLREDGVGQLDALVRDADDRLIERLTFAVADDASGRRTVVLRTRPSKLAPPELALENAVGFKPFWKLPNLFVPAGKRLHPTLRRETVRSLLADDPEQVVWLYPDGAGGFTPEMVPDAAFRPLDNWVDYVIEAEREPLAAWIGATRFDFDHFVCHEGGPKPKPPSEPKEPKGKDADAGPKGGKAAGPAARPKGAAKPAAPAVFEPLPAEAQPVSTWKARREELEKEFLAVDGPLDAPARQGLWPELATANTGEGVQSEAAVCWLNALWDADPSPSAWLDGWDRSERPSGSGPMTADEFDKRLAGKAGSAADARAVVAAFLRLAGQTPVPGWLGGRLPKVREFIDKHEGSLPVRAVWLAGHRAAQLAGGDVLGLARVRDRLLNRLLAEGLSAERDLPGFLRFAGRQDADRLRVVREKVLDLHRAAVGWSAGVPVNKPYVDLLFAFALAKLGEATAAADLLDRAGKVLDAPPPGEWASHAQFDAAVRGYANNILYRGFKYRVERALRAEPTAGPLPPDVLAAADALAAKGNELAAKAKAKPQAGAPSPTDPPPKRAKYLLDKMRQDSRVLEPDEQRDPYAVYTAEQLDPMHREVLAIGAVRDPAALAEKTRQRFRQGFPGKPVGEVRFELLHEVMMLSPRAGEAFTAELLAAVPQVLKSPEAAGGKPPDSDGFLKKQGQLLERALFVAAHFGRAETVRGLVGEFAALLRSKPEAARFKLINIVAGPSLRSLRKLGMRDEIDRLLTQIRDEVLRGATLAELRGRYGTGPITWSSVLQTLLNLATGWLAFGLDDHAAPILDAARAEVLRSFTVPPPPALPKADDKLARAYVAACGQARSGAGLARIAELLEKADPAALPNTWTGSLCYSRLHLMVVEEVVLALVNDDAGLGSAGRRWLDEDEYLVRKRVHADMDALLKKSAM